LLWRLSNSPSGPIEPTINRRFENVVPIESHQRESPPAPRAFALDMERKFWLHSGDGNTTAHNLLSQRVQVRPSEGKFRRLRASEQPPTTGQVIIGLLATERVEADFAVPLTHG
jgi:hypothetical protein